MTTVADVDKSLTGLRAISKDPRETVEARQVARRRIDEELDRRNRVAGNG